MSYRLNFEISNICDSSAVSTSISYHGNVSSYLSCGALCSSNLECVAFLFFLANSSCFLRDDVVAEVQTCDDVDIQYREVLCFQRTEEGRICTSPVDNVRLCNGSRRGAADPTMGRVEVFVNGLWGSVCDDFWENENNAKVVCKMFGFMGSATHQMAHFGFSSGPIFIDDVSCTGTESSILMCPHISEHNCQHAEDVGVECW